MSITEQIQDAFTTYNGETVISEPNHFMRRFFRCWIDGSYHGYGHYQSVCQHVRDNYANDKALRSYAIGQWCDYIAQEYGCCRSTAQRATVQHFTADELEQLNAELIDDLRDLVRDEMECEA